MRASKTLDLVFKNFRIPIKLFKGTDKDSINFHNISPCCDGRVSYKKVCKECGKEVSYSDMKKGYKVGEKMKILDKEDIEKLKGGSSKKAEILGFVRGIKDLRYLNGKVYYANISNGDDVTENQKREFNLFKEALRQKGVFAVTKFSFRSRAKVYLIKPFKHYLLLIGVRYKSGVRDTKKIGYKVEREVEEKNIKLFQKLIEKKMEEKGIGIKNFKNKSKERIKKLIKGEELEELEEEKKEVKEKELEDKLKASLETEEEEEEKVKAKA